MKIIYVSNSSIPSLAANSVHVMKMSRAFAALGHKVALISANKKHSQIEVQDVYDYYGVDKNFVIQRLLWRRYLGGRLSYSLLAALHSWWQKPAIVYSRNIESVFFLSKLKIKVALELHDVIPSQPFWVKWMFQSLIKSPHCKCIIFITNALHQHYLGEYADLCEEKTLIAPDAADEIDEKVVAAAKLKGDGQGLQIGYVGHLYQGRGIELIAELAGALPMHHFHLVGGNPADVERYLQRYAQLNNLHFYGHVPHKQVSSYMLACDVLLMPYQSNVHVDGHAGDTSKWMSPMKAFEYMAAGKAIVASDLPVLHEIFKHHHNALLLPHGNVSQWIKAIKSLDQDVGLRHKLGNQAREQMQKEFSWLGRAKKILSRIS